MNSFLLLFLCKMFFFKDIFIPQLFHFFMFADSLYKSYIIKVIV